MKEKREPEPYKLKEHEILDPKFIFNVNSDAIRSILLSRFDYSWVTAPIGAWKGRNPVLPEEDVFLRKFTLVDELPRRNKLGDKVEIKLNVFSPQIISLSSAFNIMMTHKTKKKKKKKEEMICSLCVIFKESAFPKVIEHYDVITSNVERISRFYASLHKKQVPKEGVGFENPNTSSYVYAKKKKTKKKKKIDVVNIPTQPNQGSNKTSINSTPMSPKSLKSLKERRKRRNSITGSTSLGKEIEKGSLTELEIIQLFNETIQQFVGVFTAICNCGLEKFWIKDTVFMSNNEINDYKEEKSKLKKLMEERKQSMEFDDLPFDVTDNIFTQPNEISNSEQGKDDINFFSNGKVNKFLLTALSSHLRTHGYTVVVGKDKRNVTKWVNSLSLFLLPSERKRCKLPEEGAPFVPELFVQGVILKENEKFRDVVPIKDVLFGSFPVSVVDLTTKKVYAIKRYNIFVLVKRNLEYLFENETDAKNSVIRPTHFEENKTTYPSAEIVLKTLFSIPYYLREGYISQWVRLLHRKALSFIKLIKQYRSSSEIDIDEVLRLTGTTKGDTYIIMAQAEKIEKGIYLEVFGNLTDEVETIIDFLENM